MRYDPDKHHRRSIRLKDYDYRQEGAYFVSICTQNRLCLFGDVVDGEMVLNDAGVAIKQVFNGLPTYCLGLEIDEYVVMPNHVHVVFVLTRNDVGAGLRACPLSSKDKIDKFQPDQGHPRRGAPTDEGRSTLPDVVYRFKSWTTKLYSDGVKQNGWEPFPGRLWQRNYYEHIIRNDDELNRILEYIIGNPRNWATDEENPANIAANNKLEQR